MAFADLREFLERLEAMNDLVRVQREVDLAYEIGAVCRRSMDLDGPALLFEHPRGHTMPIVTNLLANRRRMVMALESTPEAVVRDWGKRVKHPVPPIVVAAGPCKENTLVGDEIDLLRVLAVPVFNDLDGGPFITAGCHITQNPVTGQRNVGIYRNQVHGPHRLGIQAVRFRHLRQHQAEAQLEEPFPVAIVIGVDPAILIAAAVDFPYGVDELAMAGAVRGAPVEMVRCETIPLEVPATAEIVLECELLPTEVEQEGPFGEFTGYYGDAAPRSVLEVKAITYRNGAVHQAITLGKPPNESAQITQVSNEADVMAEVSLPGLRAFHLTIGGCGCLNAVASIEKRFEGYGKMVAMAILGTWTGRKIKNLIIVDSDIDPYNPTEVEWALATRVQADRDIEILKEMTGLPLDPSLRKQERVSGTSRTSKLIIDATRYDAASYEQVVEPRASVFERVVREWDSYGVPTRLPGR